MSLDEQMTSATSVIRNHIVKHNEKNSDDKIDRITIEAERISIFYVKTECETQNSDAYQSPNNNEALLRLHKLYDDMNSKVEQMQSRVCGKEEAATDLYENIELSSFWLPAQSKTQVDAVNHIVQYTKEMVKAMKEQSHKLTHPNFADRDWRNRVYDLFERCKQGDPENYFYINIFRFKAGYCVIRDEGNNQRWAKHLFHFQKACRIYYELVRHVVAVMSGNYKGGRINAEWEQQIKRAIFDIEIDHVYFKKLDSRNWPVLKLRIKNYCDRTRLSRCEESEDSDDSSTEEEEEQSVTLVPEKPAKLKF
ncbi:6195_t:CDS:1 [Paraglomus occultum]|uniref:6195_t:CDS:1 n=1 Tax=Paraglomus occultum TaxID=144539 RepID=A0A9N8VWA6_9GLOM|nr:6195_t:CDS:1 [Paraglomus occultum]